jgi:FemAB-related protein (PEP-CTERM system-associated)
MNYTLPSDLHWNTFVEQQAKDPFYYSQAWLDLLTKLYGYSVIQLTSTNTSGQLTGTLPLCFMQSPLTGRRLVSLPFSDFCQPLAIDEASTNDLLNQAIQLAREKKVNYLELRTGRDDVLAKRTDLVEGNLYVRWLLPLTTDPEIVWRGFGKPLQRQIKKAQRLDVQIRTAQHREDMEHYYQLHIRTRMRHGMPAQSRRFFFELWDRFSQSGTMQLLLAEHEKSSIAGIILITSGTTIKYVYGASDECYLHLAPNKLLLWTAIRWGCTHGYQTLDFGRTARDNHGLMEFKRRWGAIEEPLPYYYYPHTAGLAATAESSWKYRLLTACWKRLPLYIAGPLGGYLYGHLG